MADDPATAVRTDRRQRVDRALEAIEDVPLSAHDDFKRLVVFVSANFAFRHTPFVRARGGLWRCFFYVRGGANSFPANSSGLKSDGKLSKVAVISGQEGVVHANVRCYRGRSPNYR